MMVVRSEDLAIWVELVIWLYGVCSMEGGGDGGVEAVRGEGCAGRGDGGGS